LHRQFLEQHGNAHCCTSSLNAQLSDLVAEMNKRMVSQVVSITLGVLILMASLYHYLLDGSDYVWDFAKIPILLFYGLQIVRFLQIFPRFSKNIMRVEGAATAES
ncbi:MAG: hypothetical protein AAFO69_11830, partial [Bacteroidota bacterium]